MARRTTKTQAPVRARDRITAVNGPDGKDEKIVATIFGNSGIGKTRLAGTTPVPTLIIRPPTEHVDSIRGDNPIKQYIASSWSDMDDILLDLRTGLADEYEWVWLDSASGLQSIGLDDIWSMVIDEKPSRARYGPDKQEYGINMFRLNTWIRHAIGTPGFNLGITSHPAEVEGLVRPDEKLIGPWIQGKNMSHQLCHNSTIVGYYTTNSKGRRVLRLNTTDEYFAKDQFDCTPKGFMLDPTMPKLIEAIEAARATRNNPPRRSPRRRRK